MKENLAEPKDSYVSTRLEGRSHYLKSKGRSPEFFYAVPEGRSHYSSPKGGAQQFFYGAVPEGRSHFLKSRGRSPTILLPRDAGRAEPLPQVQRGGAQQFLFGATPEGRSRFPKSKAAEPSDFLSSNWKGRATSSSPKGRALTGDRRRTLILRTSAPDHVADNAHLAH